MIYWSRQAGAPETNSMGFDRESIGKSYHETVPIWACTAAGRPVL